MITITPHHFSPMLGRIGTESTMDHSQHHLHNQGGHMTGLDALAAGSHYALQMQTHARNPSFHNTSTRHHDMFNMEEQDTKDREQNDEDTQEAEQSPKKGIRTSTDGGVRRRISRACDQCNQLRTKCDGGQPCTHCVEFGLTCEYIRERKKRGKASRKDLANQNATASTPSAGQTEHSQTSPASTNEASVEILHEDNVVTLPRAGIKRRRSSVQVSERPYPPTRSISMSTQRLGHTADAPSIAQQQSHHGQGQATSYQSFENANSQNSSTNVNGMNPSQRDATFGPGVAGPTDRVPGTAGTLVNQRQALGMSDFGNVDDYHRTVLQHNASINSQDLLRSAATLPNNMMHGINMNQYSQHHFSVPSPQSQGGNQLHAFRTGASPISGNFMGASPNAGSPSWLNLPSPSSYPSLQQLQSNQSLRYPVLRPLLPRISSIIPISLACDLLDLYFASSSSAFVQPASPYILGFVLRRRSVLRQHDPRSCSQALLASMLWVGAQTSESSFLTSPPSQRGKICHQLLELTISLLNPLVHASTDPAQYGMHSVNNGVALGGFGMANPGASHDADGVSTGATAALDDVITYINLATVVSASEYKAASLRWWNAAWSLARELKLGRELPPNPQSGEQEMDDQSRVGHSDQPDTNTHHPNMQQPGVFSEEEREERRRIWWLLYTVDRHLALCYNRPLFLLDAECDGLLQPESDSVWQAPEYFPYETYEQSLYFRRRGPCFECTGHSIFGYFLPLMTILGEIVDLNKAKNHPRFGLRFRSGHEWADQAAEITQQLDAYGRSLKDFETRWIPQSDQDEVGATASSTINQANEATSPQGSTSTSPTRITEAVLQTKIVVAYGTHLMHTLHILLNGKWDPISLLDDNDLWISSESFISATGHAVNAAEAIGDILEYDPDLSFMPFFFGIYLLQGSFLLLLIADKLKGEANPSVVKACETIVRAHEVCVVTLNTEYQRNFRKVMRSALAQVKGRMPEDFGEQQQRRREVLALYRWSGDGSGLAL